MPSPKSPNKPGEADKTNPGESAKLKKEREEKEKAKQHAAETEDANGDEQAGSEEEKEEEKTPTIKAKWSKEKVTPNHNNTYPPASPPTDTVPDEAKVEMIVETEEVPDGTPASITVKHCKTGATVKDGTVSELEVKGNKVVVKATGKTPEWVFEQKHLPWDPYDAPYFQFAVSVEYKGLRAETPKDFKKKKAECLRVLYWHVQVAETSTLAGVLPECNDVNALLNKPAKDSQAMVQQLTTTSIPMANIGSLMRNTYSFHVGSHGSIQRKADDHSSSMYLDSSIQPPDFEDHTSTTPADDKGKLTGTIADWKSVVCFGQHTPASLNVARTFGPKKGTVYVNSRDFFAAPDLAGAGDFPSVPRYLFYSSTCLTGWEPGFANKLISRGCRNVLAFKRTIPDAEAPILAKKFYKKWMNTYKLNPDKIPDCFVKSTPDHYENMRPILYGKGGSETGGGMSPAAKAALVIGLLLTGVAIGLVAYSLLKK